MILANRLTIPDNTQALLWDMDGVLIDSLQLDYTICNQIVARYIGAQYVIAPDLIRESFPLDLPEFWQAILTRIGVEEKWIPQFVKEHMSARQNTIFPVHDGIQELLGAARAQQLLMAVVSNNPTQKIYEIINNAGLSNFFQLLVGNDLEKIRKKPEPDAYQLAAQLLGINPSACAVIEDSLIGVQAGHAAGCYTIGIATGANDFSVLDNCPLVNCAYSSFSAREIKFLPGAVKEKSIFTPNEFVSHMLEHIAWRIGCAVTINWNNSNWTELGQAVGNTLRKFPRRADSAATIGMIDDGSAEIMLAYSENSAVVITSTPQVERDWFLSCRCEQLANGQPLVQLLQGIATALSLKIAITVCSFEDPHHTWEGIFRAFGIALQKILITAPPELIKNESSDSIIADISAERAWKIINHSAQAIELSRTTAESMVRVALNCDNYAPAECNFQVGNSINVFGLSDLLNELMRPVRAHLAFEFRSVRLNSSHVVMEDTGMVIGRALREIVIQRMQQSGINGAGSSISRAEEIDQVPIAISLSIEGRKFWNFVPFYTTREKFRQEFLIGHIVGRGLFSEDLDDFIDGFAGGVSGSIIIHVRRPISPQEGWPLIFRALGQAIADALEVNPARRGVPPGVKATLA